MSVRSVELFSGAGGLALGLAASGFHHEAVIEWNKEACNTIRYNQSRDMDPVRDWPLYEGDVRDFDYGTLTAGIDLVAGGPPCQPFSLGGKHKGHNDNRDMFPEAVRAVREIRPKAFVFENVKGLLRSSFSSYFEYILLQLTYPEVTRKGQDSWQEHLARLEKHHTSGNPSGLRYRVVFQLLNSADYGIPQKRHRVIIVGFREDISQEWSFPVPTHSEAALLYDKFVTGDYWERNKVPKRERTEPSSPDAVKRILNESYGLGLAPWVTVRQALHDLMEMDPEEMATVANHVVYPGARVYPGHTGSPIDEPAKTLKAGGHGVPGGENMLVRPNGEVRYFTIRESARLQTFPDGFHFPGSWTESMRQLGNAVPVALAQLIGDKVRSVIGN